MMEYMKKIKIDNNPPKSIPTAIDVLHLFMLEIVRNVGKKFQVSIF